MSFVQQVNARYSVIEAKISGLREHPLSERIKQLKKPEPQKGTATIMAFDLPEGIWTKLFGKFSEITNQSNIPFKKPMDKTPHVTLAYIINATDDELEKAKTMAKEIGVKPFVINGVTFLPGTDGNIYVALDLNVTSAYRKLYNAIEKMVGRDRLREFRTFWKGHIPHASIGIIDGKYKSSVPILKDIEKKLTKLVKTEHITFVPNFIEVHKDTKLGDAVNKFSPEMIDYTSLTEA